MYFDRKSYKTYLSDEDIEKLQKIKKYLIDKVKLPKLGSYLSLDDKELWMKIVIQFCVMGGTRMIDYLEKDKIRYAEFKKKIDLNNLMSIVEGDRLNYIDNILKDFKATRFHYHQAIKIDNILKNPRVVNNGHIILLDGLSHTPPDFMKVRSELMERNPYFKLKSASDFMIVVGLSHDVIAFDTRVVGILNDYFGLNLNVNRVQGSKTIYESLESALRDACERLGISLAHLDRMLFRFKDTIVSRIMIKPSYHIT